MSWKNLLAAIVDRLKIPLPEMGGASVCDSEQEFTDCSPSFSKVISQDETIPARDELFDERKWKYWVTCYFQKSRCKNWENKDKSFHTQNVIYHFHMYWLNLPWRGLLLVCGTGLTMASPQYQKKTKKGTRLTMASPQYRLCGASYQNLTSSSKNCFLVGW